MAKKYIYNFKPGRPLKIETSEELIKLFESYVSNCFINAKDDLGKIYQKQIKPLTIVGFCNSINIHRDTFRDWMENREVNFSATCKQIKQTVEEYVVDELFTSPRTVALMFILKNNFNWIDKQEIETKNTNVNKTLPINFIDKDDLDNDNE